MSTTKITIEAGVSADRQKVWDCYTAPEHITGWNFASDDWCCPSAENDLKPGGRYRARMEAKDGSFGFDFEAVYDSVSPGSAFTYTMPDGRVVDFSLTDGDGQTLVSISFDAENENPVDMQRDGWQAILNNFKKYVETL